MKIKFIAAAVSLVCAQSAFALGSVATAAIQNGTDANGYTVYFTGASALVKSVPLALAKLCTAGSVNGFKWVGDKDAQAFSCKVAPVATLNAEGVTTMDALAGKNLLMGISVITGSLSAVKSMSTVVANRNDQINFAGATGAEAVDSGQIVMPNVFSAANKKQSSGGFMDVNPELFADILVSVAGIPAYTPTPVAAAQSFGIAVSPSLYAKLQTAQAATLPAGCTGLFTAACQPNITKQQYASIVAQANSSFMDFNVVLGTTGVTTGALCRRVPTSGTQAASNAFFLGKGCSPSALEPATAGDSTGSFIITESSSSGKVGECLGGTDAAPFAVGDAIGVISAENAATTTKWKFIKLDGVAVTEGVAGAKARQTSIDMQYNFGFEFVTVTRDAAPADDIGLLSGLATVISNPDVSDLVGIAIAPTNSFGKLNSTAGYSTKVTKASRGGNACQSPVYQF